MALEEPRGLSCRINRSGHGRAASQPDTTGPGTAHSVSAEPGPGHDQSGSHVQAVNSHGNTKPKGVVADGWGGGRGQGGAAVPTAPGQETRPLPGPACQTGEDAALFSVHSLLNSFIG